MPVVLSIEKTDERSKQSFLVVKNVNSHKLSHYLPVLDHPVFLKCNGFTDDSVSLCYRGPNLPVFLTTGMDISKRIDTDYIPQLITGLIHAHSRGMTICNIDSGSIAFYSSSAYFIDISGSLFQTGLYEHSATIEPGKYHAPETHLFKKVFPQSDYYSLALWWISAKTKKLVETWDATDFMDIHHIAMREATVLQGRMLAFEPFKRTPIEDVLTSHMEALNIQLPAPKSQSEFQAAVSKAFDNCPGAFDSLTTLLGGNPSSNTLRGLRCIVPALILSITRLCSGGDGLYGDFYMGKIESLLKFLVKLNEIDKAAWLHQFRVVPCPGLDVLFAQFAAIHSEHASTIICKFVGDKLFEPTDEFFCSLCQRKMYPGHILDVMKLSKNTPILNVLRSIIAGDGDRDLELQMTKDALAKKTLELEEHIKDHNAAMERKEHESLQDKTELEQYRTAAAAFASVVAGLPSKKAKADGA